MYDFLIIGGGAAGLFCALSLPKTKNKAIIEKTDKLGSKILLSGGGRCNFSNRNIEPLQDYFGQDKKMLPSLFHKFGSAEMRYFLEDNKIKTKEENNGRLILESGKAQELLTFLIKAAQENETEQYFNQDIKLIEKQENNFIIKTDKDTIETKNLIIATGGKSFPQIGATDFGIQIAQQFGIETAEMQQGLCGIETKENVGLLTGNSCQGSVQLLYQQKTIYQETGNVLFTHRGVSGPVIFNISNALSEYCIKKQIGPTNINDFSITISINPTTTIKKIINHFGLTNGKTKISLTIKQLRPWEEAKISVGGVILQELKPTMECKKVPGLYFIGETIDITGKTGGYNLQRCWTSAYACAKSFK